MLEMPTALFHTAVPLALGLGLGRSTISGRLLAAGIACSMLPGTEGKAGAVTPAGWRRCGQ